MDKLLNKGKNLLKYSSPMSWLICEGMEKAAKAIDGASQGSTEDLEIEMLKQKMKMEFSQSQARISQELAIAKRIENADDVEIEEFYDASGKGNLGLKADLKSETASLGIGGEGRKITKRIYHFRGWRDNNEEVVVEPNVD